MAMAPYEAMPFQEIERAVCSTPTWPMHQLMVPTPISPWATPSSRRPAIRISRLGRGKLCSKVEINVSTPLSTIPDSP
ncbi:hypothetical protein D3C76_1402030 [compost metagenome]